MSDQVQAEGQQAVKKQRSYIPKALLVKCKEDYLNGNGSIREIAELYNVSYVALAAKCSRENWRNDSEKVVKKVIETVERVEASRLERLHAHEERMILRMEKRLVSVDKSLEQVGDLVEPQDLKAIVGTESTVDQVIRRSLGANDKIDQQAPVTVNVVNILDKLREAKSHETVIDVEAEVSELKEMVKQLGEE